MTGGLQRFVSEFLLVTAGKVVSLGALFVCAAIVSRFSGPAELGRFYAALTVALLVDAAIGGSLDFAAVRFSALHKNELQRVARFHGATFRLKATVVLAIAAAAILARGPLATLLFADPAEAPLVVSTALTIAALVFLRSVFAWLQTATRFRAYAALDLCNGILRVAAIAAVGLLGIRSAEAFLGVLAAAILGAYLTSFTFIRQPYLTAPRPEPHDSRAIFGFFGATALILILGSFTGRSDVFFVHRLISAEAAGVYGAAAQLATVITMLASYACVVLQPRLMHAGAASIRRLALLSAAAGLAAAAALLPASHFFGADALTLAFGDPTFASAQPLLTILLIGTCLDITFMPVLMTYALQVRPRASLAGELLITAAFVAAIALSGRDGALTIAWIATGARIAKLALYATLALTTPHRHQEPTYDGRSV